MLGGIFPLKKGRGAPAFANLFSAFENSTTKTMAKTAAPVTKATAASNQVAEAMIRSMLGSPASAPVTMKAATTVAPAAPEIENDSQSASTQTQAKAASAGAQAMTDEESLVRSMLGLASSSAPAPRLEDQTEASADESGNQQPPMEQESALTIPAEMELTPETDLENAPAPSALPAQKAAQPKNQNVARAASAPARQETKSAAAPLAPEVARTAPVSTQTPVPAPFPFDTPAPAAQNSPTPASTHRAETAPAATRLQNGATVRTTALATEAAGPAFSDTETVERTTETPHNSSEPAALAFSADLTPMATSTTPEPIDNPAAAPQSACPIADSQPMAASLKSGDAQPAANDNDQTKSIAPQKSEGGNAGRHDESSPDREAQDMVKSAEPAKAIPVAAGGTEAGGFSIVAENGPDRPANRAVETPGTAQPSAAASQLAETNSPVAAKNGGTAPEISVRISPPDSPVVDLHVTERGGEIHVAVRTADTELQTSLRQDLGTLTSSLERAGYHAETFVPRAGPASQSTLRDERQQQGFSGRGGSHSESGSGKQKEQRQPRGASWLEELEQSR